MMIEPLSPTERLLNDLVRAQQYRPRNRDAERLGCLKVDDQIQLGRLLNRQVSGFRAL